MRAVEDEGVLQTCLSEVQSQPESECFWVLSEAAK